MSGPDQGLAQIAALLKNTTPPDVLETIAHISSDEVLTPPKLANRVLDLLPAHIWHDPRIKILDPAVKSGVFLREAAKRLMVGLADVIPDVTERREHIMRKMLYGIAITELTALMSRRSLYCASDATREKNPAAPENCYSAVIFETADGNIAFPETDHVYDVRGKCRVCGANRGDLDGADREGRENHAYPFIHRTIEEIFGEDMKFDVIIGNPPYQLKSEGTRDNPIYNKFIDKSKSIFPRHMAFIIPSKWMAGGLGLSAFRSKMLGDRSIKELIDIPDASEVFPGVDVKGGVCIVHFDEGHNGMCSFSSIRKGERTKPVLRNLDEHDILVRDVNSISIIKKIVERSDFSSISDILSSDKEFGWSSNFRDFDDKGPDLIEIYYNHERQRLKSKVRRSNVRKSQKLIDKWKVMVPKAGDGSADLPVSVLGKPFIAPSPSVCTQTYLFFYVDFESEARSIEGYYKTKFFRFMVHLRKITHDATRSTYNWVPSLPWTEVWTDPVLYEHFGLTEDEIAFIEATIKDMP